MPPPAAPAAGPANLATNPRRPFIAALKDAGYLHIPEGRRDHTTPSRNPPPFTGLDLRQMRNIHGNTPEALHREPQRDRPPIARAALVLTLFEHKRLT